MRILFLGDVVGRSGRDAVVRLLPGLREELRLHAVIVNGENATSGAGLSAAHARLLLEAGADVVTLGDHAFDQREMLEFIQSEPRVLRPVNYSRAAPGAGARVFEVRGGRRILVAQVLGRVFMKQPFDDPFSAIEPVLKAHPPGGSVQASFIDVHCEATSEKAALGWFCDGRASAVAGTHTHVPTADVRVLPGGTAFVTDAGMCGDYDSVIGMDREEPLRRFVTGISRGRFSPASGPGTLSGLLVETDDRSGKALRAEGFRRGGVLGNG